MKPNFVRKGFLLILLLFFSLGVRAALLHNIPLVVVQPDGTNLTVYASGDEFYNWIHDSNGYTIVKDPVSGFYVYAALNGDELVPTPYIVGQSDPQSAGLAPRVNIPAWKYRVLRDKVLEATPKMPAFSLPATNGPSDITGTLNNLVVFIRFSDQAEFTQELSYYDNMFNNSTAGYNSMYNYFKEASYNQMFVTSTYYPLPSGTVIVSYQDSHPRSYFMPYDEEDNPDGYQEGERTMREHTLLKDASEFVASQVPVGLDLDINDDNRVDNVCYIVKGGTTAWSTLLWPHRWSLFSHTVYINGKRVWDYNFQLETFLSGSGVGVLAHEMTHTFGAPDLYHYNGDGFSPAGPWDIMDGTANPPQHMGAFLKYKYCGWIDNIPAITSEGTYTLNPLTASANNVFKLASPNSDLEYFLFEYRKDEGPFESSIPGTGLLIYRINPAAGNGNADGPPDEVYIYRPNGTISENGSLYDANFSLEEDRTEFNNTSNPNDFLSDGVTLGDLSISNITSAGTTISFTVEFGLVANFTASLTSGCFNQTVTLQDQSTGGPTTWSWSFSPSTVVYVNGTSAASQSPQVQFTAAGSYSVTLVVSNAQGSNTKTRTDYITIQNSTTVPFSDDFESGSFMTQGWTVNNPDALMTWAIRDNVQGNGPGTQSAWMNFYTYGNYPQTDELVLPPVTLPETGSAELSFRVAYRQYSASYHDSLKIVLSTDCGSTYPVLLYARTGDSLDTKPPSTSEFFPSMESDWRTDVIPLTPYLGNTVKIKFQGVNGYGNNLFIDDISIGGNVPVAAGFSAAQTDVCAGAPLQFTDQSTGFPDTWNWSFGDGGTSLLQHPVHQYAQPGTYTVTLTVSKPGSTDTEVKTNYITVNPTYPVSVSIIQTPPGSFCQNSEVSFQASVINGGPAPVYEWLVNGVAAGGNEPVFTTSGLADFDMIACLVTSGIGCPANNPALSNVITVSVIPDAPVGVSITASPPGAVCEGTPVTYTAFPVNGGADPQFQWFRDGLFSGVGNLLNLTDPADGEIIYCILNSSITVCVSGNPAMSNTLVADIHPYPAVDLGNDTIIPANETLLLDAGPGFTQYAWNTGATTQTLTVTESGDYSVTVSDDIGCSGTGSIYVHVGYTTLSGFITYLNSTSTPMNDASVTLKQGNAVIADTVTGSDGHYHFTGLIPGTYTLHTATTKPWGGVNATDALMIMKHFAALTPLAGLKLLAANVDNSPTVNSIDALMAQKRSVGILNSFPLGDWVFERPSVLIDGFSDVVQDIHALTAGDVNGSFNPPAREAGNVILVETPARASLSGTAFDLPLLASSAAAIGAITLHFSHPREAMTLTSVTMDHPEGGNLVYSVRDDRISIAWASLEPLILEAMQPVITLHFALASPEVPDTPLSCLAGSEIADPDGNALPAVTLLLPLQGLNVAEQDLAPLVFPNPCRTTASIRFFRPEAGHVTLNLHTPAGETIRNLFDGFAGEGIHRVELAVSPAGGESLSAGIYLLRLIAGAQVYTGRFVVLPE